MTAARGPDIPAARGPEIPVDRATLAAYARGAGTYATRDAGPEAGRDPARATALVAARAALLRASPAEPPPTALAPPEAPAVGPVLDLGCGPGPHLGRLGPDVVGVDPVGPMLAEARRARPDARLVRATAGALPFRPRSLGGAWVHKVLQHVPRPYLPLALADLHRSLPVGAPLAVTTFAGTGERTADDDLPGRRFVLWEADALADAARGAGFVDVVVDREQPAGAGHWPRLHLTATRGRTLPDVAAPGMRLLVCGLNPSLHAADAGVGYAGPGNRFWPALAEAGLLPPGADRDPWRLLADGGIGMTDLVKRATPRADEVTGAEFRDGLARVERLCALVEPGAVVLVGLAGWRAAADRTARPGWQDRRLGTTPVYVMPSTSGLNAGTSRAALVDHLRAAAHPPAGP